MKIESLKKRADFLDLRRAPAISKRGFKLVRGYANRDKLDCEGVKYDVVRVGFTVTKKLGNAVRRNRIKRRLKSAIISLLPLQEEANADYVVIAHRGAYDMPYGDLLKEMKQALTDIQLGPIKRGDMRDRNHKNKTQNKN